MIALLTQVENLKHIIRAQETIDLRVLPLGLSGVFLFLQLLGALIRGVSSISNQEDGNSPDIAELVNIRTHREGMLHRLKSFPHILGRYRIFGFMVARLAGSLTLLYLSSITAAQECKGNPVERFTTCPAYWMSVTFAYATVLAFATFFTQQKPNWTARYHTMVLLSALGVYVYRDIWPLATYHSKPADNGEGILLWAKVAILTFTAVSIPLFIPHPYVPVDPQNPAPEPNPEQTASWFSALTYSYLDPLIILANKVVHLSYEQLPPLADYDRAQYLTNRAFPYIDPFAGAKRRHIFFGLLLFFRMEFTNMLIYLLLLGLCNFVAPIGINQILAYLETQGSDASVKPWVWITFMFIGPTLQSVLEHWYLFVQTKIRVRLQALITQLVFQHSLRIRLKAETATGSTNDGQSPSSTLTREGNEESFHSIDSSVVLASISTMASSELGHTTDGEGSSSTMQTTTVTASAREASSSSTLQSSLKGKSKVSDVDMSLTPPAKKRPANADNLIGKINNLVTTDLDNIQEGADFLALTFYAPLQITLSMLFLYRILGWSAVVGLVTTIVLSPTVGYLGKLIQDVQSIKMKSTDARVQEISEAVGIIRMIKLFGWERKMAGRLEIKRTEELQWLWKLKFLKTSNELLSLFIPSLTTVATYATYTVIMKEELTASTIFSSMAVFSILREQLHRLSWQYNLLVDAKVSLDRLSEFLQTTELLDRFTKPRTSPSSIGFPGAQENADAASELGFRNATFGWSVEDNDGLLTPSSRDFRLHIDGELLFKRNCINLIIGPTGSGKTSVLMALLGEMHFIPSTTDSWFNLPRQGGVAYAAQESWVQNATIRDNILFGSPYDEERYQKVIRQCALEHDLELFDAGDRTEVGERGLTLSGGQKARITLARAIYSPADIILLDDVLAALDVHTSAWIVDKCFRGDLVKGRTVLLVTHNVRLASPVAHFVVSLALDGSIKTQGYEVSTALQSDPLLAAEVKQEEVAIRAKEADSAPEKTPDGKLIVAEEIVEGHITWRSMRLLFKGLGGHHYILFAILWMLSMFAEEALYTLQTWFLGVWGSQYEMHDPSEIDLTYYISTFSLLLVAHIVFFTSVQLYYNYRTIRASRVIHAELIDSVFGSTLRWLDETPTARIIARCTQDIRTIDGPIPQSLMWVFNQSAGMLTKLAVIVLFTPVFLFPGIGVAILGILLGKAYLKAQLSIKREMSNARSPLLAHFSAAMHGLAYGAQKPFSEESLKRIDYYCRAAATSFNVNRWIGHRIDVLGAAFTSALAFYLVYGTTVGAANTGFSLNMAVSFCIYIFWLIRIYNELEVQSNSLERIQGYIDIDHEPKATESGQPPAAWPTSGDLRVESLSARYSLSGPRVLHNLSFHITPGQRVGIVGRTGSGKSSLTLALLRCIITEGTVYYDGIATNTINLDALRSNITIIPQTPELLSGTLRQNLDPFDQNDDATLNDALRAAGLFSLQEDVGEARLTLDSKIAGGGSNLSVGQRQIIALARAIVRGSKLLILDEATSAIDYKTDAVIQRTLRSQLSDDVTVLTVAHRLQTIMDADKIMVLENGHIVEFDSPKVLIKKEKGIFRALVDKSGDKEMLHSPILLSSLFDVATFSSQMASGSRVQAPIDHVPSHCPNLTTHSTSDVRRIFVGPMPERVIAQGEAQGKKPKLTIGSALSLGSHMENVRPENGDRSEEVAKALREQAFQFFLHHGGKAEDWGDESEEGLVEELTKRWKESEWGQLWERRHRHKKGPQSAVSSTHWFGTSFEVGNLLGLNVMNGQEHVTSKSIPSTRKSQSSVINETGPTGSVAPTGQQTFITAPSTFGTASTQQLNTETGRERPSQDCLEAHDVPPSPASSRTGLLLSQRNAAASQDANLTTNYGPTEIAEPLTPNMKGKSRMVHYADVDTREPVSTPGPVTPEAVLERTHSTVDQNTSMAATIPDGPPTIDATDEMIWGDVVLRDRMLVKASFTKSESLPYFNDEVNRTTRNLHFEDWGEFLVAWRRDAIEIYRDHRTFGSCKDWAVGHKHLSYVIPLKSSRTHLSLYSFVDLTFCITCAPTTTKLNATASRWIFSKEKEGTNIFIFKLKSRSRAYDWSWQLWRQMGGKIPRSIDIHSSRLSTKVTIDVPEGEELQNGSLYRVFKRENILNLCMNALRKVPDWDYLMESQLAKGKSLQLAWRVDANLDWIWLETDVSEKPRDWAVLCGLPFKHSSRHPTLEVRLAEHNPTYIHLKNSRRLDEPPAIEGYLDRIRPSTQTKQQIYLSTHNGYLFTLDPFAAFPPMPPGLAPIADVYADAQALRQAEIRRGTNQIISATGVCDLRTIVAVRRASHPTPSQMHNVTEVAHEDSAWLSVWENPEERDGEDEGDEGGEPGLSKHGDRPRLRTKRSFELLLKTGHVVRFEAHSCQVALEWVERLRALVFYWKSRHRHDAKQEIELAQAQRPRLTPQTRVFEDEHEYPPEAPPDPSSTYGAIDRLYNWCVLEGCRPITKGGRIYMKKGLHGQYQLMQLFLVAGHLVPFRVGPNSSLYPAMRKKINLLDAYVCSGYFAAQTLPKGQYLPNADLVPRRYQDGLETDDREEDMLFMIWYRPHNQMSSAAQDPTTTPLEVKLPNLSAKNKMLVFKARSVLERDSWCWALNSEIEKIVRAQRRREEKLRETGNLVSLK